MSATLAVALASVALCDPPPVVDGSRDSPNSTAPVGLVSGLERIAAPDHRTITGRRGFPELAVILEDKVSVLAEITRIQEELIGFARRDPLAAHALRLPVSICEMVLPAPWCAQLTATFRPEPGQ